MFALVYSKTHFLKTLLFALLIFVVVVSVCEVLLTHVTLREHLPLQDFGTGYDPIEDYVMMLDVFSNEHNGVDCVILGTSMARTGINPDYFSKGYERRTGQPISCFNAGISGMTASSAGPLAQYIVDRYHPKLLIYATSFIDYDKNRQSVFEEDMFPRSNWAAFWSGKFSVEGLLLNDFRSYSYLKAVPGILQTGKAAILQDVYDSTVEGFAPRAWFYKNRSPTLDLLIPNAFPLSDIYANEFAFSNEDFDGLRQIMSLKDQGVELIMIEMPAYLTPDEWQTANTPADKSGWYDFSQVVAPYARDRGVPFWTTSDLQVIPPTAWNDRLHLFFTEAPSYSIWLGEQLGEATSQGIFTDDPAPELLSGPPLDIPLPGPDPQQQARLGLSEAHYEMLQDARSTFDLMPPGSTLFIPEHGLLNRDFLQSTLGGYIEWYFRFGAASIQPDNVEVISTQSTLFDLMILLSDMQYEEDLTLSASQQSALDVWRSTKQPEALRASGIEYIFFSDLWLSWLSDEDAAILTDPQNYELVETVYHPAVRWYYHLYRVLGEADDK